MLWTIAAARLILGAAMNIQAPPNLSPGVYQRLVDAGLNDWGGVSPVTPDHVNPEAPWPAIVELGYADGGGRQAAGRTGCRSTRPTHARPTSGSRPRSPRRCAGWRMRRAWRAMMPGRRARRPPPPMPAILARSVDVAVDRAIDKAAGGDRLDPPEIVRLFAARDADYRRVTSAADELRRSVSGGRRALRRQPQHQLHQYLLLSLSLLRLLQGQDA
ncbi:MAG: hypothetical protein WDN49_03225 [Acetobacteraceae bacterium]